MGRFAVAGALAIFRLREQEASVAARQWDLRRHLQRQHGDDFEDQRTEGRCVNQTTPLKLIFFWPADAPTSVVRSSIEKASKQALLNGQSVGA
jgi:hypothetical protein